MKRWILLFLLVISSFSQASEEELISAIMSGKCDQVSRILASGVSPNTEFKYFRTDTYMPVIFIDVRSSEECIKAVLIKNGASIEAQVNVKDIIRTENDFYASPLSSAVMFGSIKQVKLYLKLGARVDSKDRYGSNLIDNAFLYRGNSAPNITKELRMVLDGARNET
jgi:ankyrin repeat protein